MKRGFTIIELLVASMLLGMLVTILTMIFNQSSIAWRIGAAMTSKMDDMRDNMATLREEADNAFVYGDGTRIYRTVGLWKNDGTLRDRACDAPNSTVQSEVGASAKLLQNSTASSDILDSMPWRSTYLVKVGDKPDHGSSANYVVNVMSKGPNNDENDWQAIFSYPDDPEEWCK